MKYQHCHINSFATSIHLGLTWYIYRILHVHAYPIHTPTSTDWWGIPAIREEVDVCVWYPGLFGCCQQSLEMCDVAMHSSIADQPQKVKSTTLTLDFVKSSNQLRPCVEGVVFYCHIDSYYVLWVWAQYHYMYRGYCGAGNTIIVYSFMQPWICMCPVVSYNADTRAWCHQSNRWCVILLCIMLWSHKQITM